jgi:phospholipid-binding lipoprotein MlaA
MRSLFLPVVASLALGACATPGGQRLAEQDPLENFNRRMWNVNMAFDRVAFKPATVAYRTVTPKPAQRGLRRILANLQEPFSFANSLLQGKPDQAARTFGRFIINTTIGVGGLADHATGFGLPEESEDFGQTLAVWGVNAGPYIVLPLFGPSTLRDSVGLGVEFTADPAQIAIREESGLTRTQRWGITGMRAIDARSRLIDSGADAVLETSADPYATARSAYLQQRAAAIADGGGAQPGIDPDDFSDGSVDPADFETADEAMSPPPEATPPVEKAPETVVD